MWEKLHIYNKEFVSKSVRPTTLMMSLLCSFLTVTSTLALSWKCTKKQLVCYSIKLFNVFLSFQEAMVWVFKVSTASTTFHPTIHAHIPSYSQFIISRWPHVHVYGLWEEARVLRESMQTKKDPGIKPRTFLLWGSDVTTLLSCSCIR